jgi:hypothetical protein
MPDDLVAWLNEQGCAWVLRERALHRPASNPLPDDLKSSLAPFFGAAILDGARWRHVPGIQNPPFLDQAIGMGVPGDAIDFSAMAGITFQDTMLLTSVVPPGTDAGTKALVFHELVHVVQYTVLGLDSFVQQYVEGLALGGFDYFAIPLEIVAYALQARYMVNPQEGFSVEDLLRKTATLAYRV